MKKPMSLFYSKADIERLINEDIEKKGFKPKKTFSFSHKNNIQTRNVDAPINEASSDNMGFWIEIDPIDPITPSIVDLRYFLCIVNFEGKFDNTPTKFITFPFISPEIPTSKEIINESDRYYSKSSIEIASISCVSEFSSEDLKRFFGEP